MIKVTRIIKEFTPEFMERLEKKKADYEAAIADFPDDELIPPTVKVKEGDMIEMKAPFYIHPTNIRVISTDFDGHFLQTIWDEDIDITDTPARVYKKIEEFWKKERTSLA